MHVGRSNTVAVAAGVTVALLLFVVVISVILIVAIYMNTRRLKGCATPGKQEIKSVNKTFSIKEPTDSPDHHYEEPAVTTASSDEEDKHASVPKPAEKTVLQKALHEELAAFV